MEALVKIAWDGGSGPVDGNLCCDCEWRMAVIAIDGVVSLGRTSERSSCGPGLATRNAFAICFDCASIPFLLSRIVVCSADTCPGLNNDVAAEEDAVSVVLENTDAAFGSLDASGFLDWEGGVVDGSIADGDAGGAADVGVGESLGAAAGESPRSAVETPTTFSLLNGESPQVDRDCCASVYRQSALFLLQFEHGMPLSHLRWKTTTNTI